MTYYSRSKPLKGFEIACGADGIRTHYLFNAIEALSQLSYSPIKPCIQLDSRVEPMGFEPTTSSVRLKRSPN